jgi:hypothetical protein
MKTVFKLLPLYFIILLLSRLTTSAYAIVDPFSTPNNKFGVHILFPSEIHEAARLVNSSGGDWGYVTIPIQAGDKDLIKWQKFMDDAKTLHITPIIRLATEGDYFKNSVWRKPNFADVLDFANFLQSLDWPTRNRYVIVFNETNRADEWGGEVNAGEYAYILSYAVETFKSKYSDFFIISAGLDNAAENVEGQSRNQYSFMQEMYNAVRSVFNQIDAVSSHSYPNPGFRQPPWVLTRRSISSFIYEKRLADFLGDKDLPVFITETGWSKDETSDTQIASYYKEAFESVWADKNIAAVTPFLLHGGNGTFAQFSLIKENEDLYEDYKAIKEISKVKGNPILTIDVNKSFIQKNEILPTRDFSDYEESVRESKAKDKVTTAAKFVKWLLKMEI